MSFIRDQPKTAAKAISTATATATEQK